MAGNYEKSIYNHLMDVMARLDTVEKENRQEVSRLNGEISSLKKENHDLREENRLLRDDNARLKSIINNDSSNTSLPPSTDRKGGKPANTYNSREKTGRRAGGQKGHRGTTLTKADIEEKIKNGRCRHEVRSMGDVSSGRYITKYVLDISVVPVITEIRIYADKKGHFTIPPQYRSDVAYGADIKSLAVSLYSEGVMSNDRIAAFLNAASGHELHLSEGSVYSFCRKFSERAGQSILHLEQGLLNQSVVATDATTVTVNGVQEYIRNTSTEETVVYHAMKDKTIDSLKGLPFFAAYSGILVHDHEAALYHFGTGHGECNAHLLRYLKKNTEETGNEWSGKMAELFRRMNRERKELIKAGVSSFQAAAIGGFEREYACLVEEGRKENKATAHPYAKSDEKTLLNRLEKYSRNHLLFLHDFCVPFDDNISERDLRKAKNRQKMAGGFRKDSGHEMYCSILTIIETLKKRKMGMIENIRKLFMGAPAIF